MTDARGESINYLDLPEAVMANPGTGGRLREFHEYTLKPTRDLILQGEFGFLAGAIVEEMTSRNPYFWYRKRRGKDQIVTRTVRGHKMKIDLYDRGISRHLFIRGVHEAPATAAYRTALAELAAKIKDELTVFEVGANLGYYVLEVASVLDGRTAIYAFEPDPENRSLLKKNVELNGYDEMVEILPQAVDDTSGQKTFCRSTHSNWNRLKQKHKSGNDDRFVEQFSVETTNLDGFLAQHNIKPSAVNALRMDLEGHEIAVLRGMEKVLAAGGPLVLFIEFHPNFVERSEYEWALSVLEDHGFGIEFVNQKWNVLDIDSFEELREIQGSHVRIVFARNVG